MPLRQSFNSDSLTDCLQSFTSSMCIRSADTHISRYASIEYSCQLPALRASLFHSACISSLMLGQCASTLASHHSMKSGGNSSSKSGSKWSAPLDNTSAGAVLNTMPGDSIRTLQTHSSTALPRNRGGVCGNFSRILFWYHHSRGQSSQVLACEADNRLNGPISSVSVSATCTGMTL